MSAINVPPSVTTHPVDQTVVAGQPVTFTVGASGSPTPNTPGLNGAGVLNQYYVETSNVNVAEAMVSMIQTQRAYELNSKVVSTSDAMLARLTQL